MSQPGILIITNLGPNDEVFESDAIGSWNTTRAQRDCQAGKHKRWLFTVADAYAANTEVEVDEQKVAAMVADPDRLANAPPLIIVIQDGKAFLIDGHHRLRALHRLSVIDCICWVIEAEDAERYRVLYNGRQKLKEA